MQTSSIKDAISLVDDMSATDPGYRHYVRLKGTLVCDAPIPAPFSNRSASYYANLCLSVSEQTNVYQNQNGSYGESRFLGYRLNEKNFPPNGPVYVLGELLHMCDHYVIEKAQLSKKPSLLSYKFEEQIVREHKTTQTTSLLIGGDMALAGIAMIIMYFT